MIKTVIRFVLTTFFAAAMLAGCAPRKQTLVVLSTNDMHSKIKFFPQLAAAVEACRDTARMVLLVDAGDRWTGDAYSDMASLPGMPIIELMNRLGYDAGTLGNHEFDFGQAHLAQMIDSMRFDVVCANVDVDTSVLRQPLPYTIICRGGLRIGFVGVVTNYEGGTPAGKSESFTGLGFPDPQKRAIDYAAELRGKCDVLILLSHMGDNRDMEMAAKGPSEYDLIVGGHTHVVLDTLINGTLITQTGKYLTNVGATTIRLEGKKVVGVDFRLVPLSGYKPDAAYAAQLKRYYDDPYLSEQVGSITATADIWGLANWMAASIASATHAEVGFYHFGGVRLDSLPAGSVRRADIYNLDTFKTQVFTATMTPSQMRQLIVTKYNGDAKEGGRVDLVSTAPYTIITDSSGKRAIDVDFGSLREKRKYRVAMSSYIYQHPYKGLDYDKGVLDTTRVTSILFGELERGPLTPDNAPRQSIRAVNAKAANIK